MMNIINGINASASRRANKGNNSTEQIIQIIIIKFFNPLENFYKLFFISGENTKEIEIIVPEKIIKRGNTKITISVIRRIIEINLHLFLFSDL